MCFQKTSFNSKDLLNEMVLSGNPTKLLCDKFDEASSKENKELKNSIRELTENGYIKVKWVNDRPVQVLINNSPATNKEQLADDIFQRKGSYIQKITIGNNNKIKNSKISNSSESYENDEKKGFYECHPVICSIIISLGVGFILLFPFWHTIINFIEGLFKR